MIVQWRRLDYPTQRNSIHFSHARDQETAMKKFRAYLKVIGLSKESAVVVSIKEAEKKEQASN